MALSPAERQRRYQERKRAEWAALPKVRCACGCDTEISPISSMGKPARYAHGHNPSGETTRFQKGQEAWNRGRPAPWTTAAKKGKPLALEAVAKRQATRRASGKPPKRGWQHTNETRARMAEAVRARDLTGERNPFHGRKHTPESISAGVAKRTGELSAAWRGGVGVLPYGPGFTRKFKKLIRERDGYRCRRCGISQSEWGKTLQIHHLDHDKSNNDPTNLVTACGPCNVWASYHRDEPFLP